MRVGSAVLLGVLGLLVSGGWLALQAENRPQRAAEAAPEKGRGTVVALGRVEPVSEEIHVSAAMTGRIATVPVVEGQAVAAGAVIATLEGADLEARVREAEAGLKVAQAALLRVLNGARSAERQEAAAAVAEAEALVLQAARELQRQSDLVAQRAGSRQELDRARSDHDVAVARLSRAGFQRDTIDSPPREDEKAKAEAEVALAEARLALARAIHDKTLIRSPVAGVVLRKLRHPGELVSDMADTPIAVVGDLSTLRVRAEVDEADIARIRVDQPAFVTADAYGDRRFTGKVVRVGRLVGRKAIRSEKSGERLDSRVLEVLIELDGTDPLPVGLRVDAYLPVAPE